MDPKASQITNVTENGVQISQAVGKKHTRKYHPKLSVLRQFILATVDVFAKAQKETAKTYGSSNGGDRSTEYHACDLSSADSGLAGLQWKRHLGRDLHVTLVSLTNPQQLHDAATANGFTLSPLALDLKSTSLAGSYTQPQDGNCVYVAQCDPAALLVLRAFDFMHLFLYKEGWPALSVVFRNIRNLGVISLVVPDMRSYARDSTILKRRFGADCINTGYFKELSARILLASLAQEAARCNKGLRVLYAVFVEDFLLVGLQVKRGAKMAEAALQNVGRLLHCRMCEERVILPDAIAPLEKPYSLLSCDCQENIPGKTAVVLGPLWKGSIYDHSCLLGMAKSGERLSFDRNFFTFLQSVMEDSLCNDPPSLPVLMGTLWKVPKPPTNKGDNKGNGKPVEKVSNSTTVDRKNGENGVLSSLTSPQVEEGGGKASGLTVESCGKSAESCVTTNVEGSGLLGARKDETVTIDSNGGERFENNLGVKRKAAESESGPQQKVQRSDGILADAPQGAELDTFPSTPAPCFYYNIHGKGLNKKNCPKNGVVVERLRSRGYRCSQTHFQLYSIRTDADMRAVQWALGPAADKVPYVRGAQNPTT